MHAYIFLEELKVLLQLYLLSAIIVDCDQTLFFFSPDCKVKSNKQYKPKTAQRRQITNRSPRQSFCSLQKEYREDCLRTGFVNALFLDASSERNEPLTPVYPV
jgi:hypothetical protein